MGEDMKVLRLLPTQFNTLLRADICQTMESIWKVMLAPETVHTLVSILLLDHMCVYLMQAKIKCLNIGKRMGQSLSYTRH